MIKQLSIVYCVTQDCAYLVLESSFKRVEADLSENQVKRADNFSLIMEIQDGLDS